MDVGLRLFLSAATPGGGGGRPPGIGGAAPGGGGAAPGGFGAAPRGGLGAELRDVSGSERYDELLSAPVLTPPDLRNLGMPPANKPPNCGAALAAPPSLAASPPVSLLLLARFPGTGGASPVGGAGARPMPGTGGAPPTGGPLGPSDTLPTIGADRSLTWVTFFSRAPLLISESSAPYASQLESGNLGRDLSPAEGHNILFRLLRGVFLPELSQALEAAAAGLQRLGPWAAWAEGEEEVVVRAWRRCRVRARTQGTCGILFFCASSGVCGVWYMTVLLPAPRGRRARVGLSGRDG